MAVVSKIIVSMIKNRWREILIVILSAVSYFSLTKEPEIKEVVKVEYKDRIVEKIVTVEKEVVKDKTKRTTVEKPDGTKIITETTTNTQSKQNKVSDKKEEEKKQTVEIDKQINKKSRYNLGISAKIYPELEYSVNAYARIGDLPIFIGPTIYVKQTDHLQLSYGLGVQLEI